MEEQVELTRDDVAEFLGEGVSDDVLAEYAEVSETEETTEATAEVEETVKPDIKEVTEEPEPEVEVEAKEAKPEVEPEPEETADILSKSGKYTIPYEKLESARDSAKTSAEAEQRALQEIERLRSELSLARKTETEPQQEESQEDMEALADEFPAAASMLKNLQNEISALKQQNVDAESKFEERQESMHFNMIEDAHKDSQEILTSVEFENFVKEQSPILKNAYISVYQNGTQAEVIEMLNAFKNSQVVVEPKPEPKATIDVAAKVKEVQDKEVLPTSLSDVPGSANPTDPVEGLLESANIGGAIDKMYAGKTSEQIEAMVSKLLR